MRRRMLWLAAVALGLAAITLGYRGPGQLIVRGHLGDVAIAMWIYALLGLLRPATRPLTRGALVFGFAAAVEVGQTLWNTRGSKVGELVLGSTFDAWDFVAYALGTAIAIAWTPRPIAR